MSFAFKKFNFFQQTDISTGDTGRNGTCYVASSSYLYVGCDNGSIQALNERAQVVFSFSAHGSRVFHAVWIEQGNLLITVGSEEPGYSSSTLKIWECGKLEALSTSLSSPEVHNAGSSRQRNAISSPSGALLRSSKVFSPRYPEAEITAMAATSSSQRPASLSLSVVLGLSSGMVYIMTADMSAKGKVQHTTKLSARPDTGDRFCVTGVVWHSQSHPGGNSLSKAATDSSASQAGEADGALTPLLVPLLQSLYVVTESQTLSFNVQTGLKTILDQMGTKQPRCCLLRNGLLVVARSEGLYDYTLDTRAGCTVFEGAKQQVAALKRFLVVVTSETGNLGAPCSTIHILDPRNRMSVASITIQHVTSVIPAWGALVVVTGLGHTYLLREVELAIQLDTLFKRSLHKLALDVAKAEGADSATIASIQQRWGDHLYNKGEYDAAMAQYLETLSSLEPSYVIRRFLDAQRIHNLTCYLETLHSKGMASADHTTLLLNCYTKLKDVDKLDAFIYGGLGADQSTDLSAATSEGNLEAEVTTGPAAGSGSSLGSMGLEVLGAFIRDSEVSHPKAVSTRKGSKGGEDLSIAPPRASTSGRLLKASNGQHEYRDAPVARDLGGHGTILGGASSGGHRLWKDAAPTASLPIQLQFDAETAVKVLRSAGYFTHALWVANTAKQPDWVLEILLDDCGSYDEAIEFLDTLPRRERAAALRKYGKVLISQRAEAATRLLMELCIGGGHGGAKVQVGAEDEASFVSSVADFAHLYSDRPTALMLLCEFIMNSGGSSSSASPISPESHQHEKMLYHTLLELYLADHLPDQDQGTSGQRGASDAVAASTSESSVTANLHKPQASGTNNGSAPDDPHLKAGRRARALELLQKGWASHLVNEPKYDPDHALVLCRLHGFRDGLVFLYDKLRLHREVLQVHMETGDNAALIAATIKYGDVSKGGDAQLWAEVLEYFVQQAGPDCLQALSQETQDLGKVREQVSKLAAETAALQAEAHKLKTQPRVFQNSKCAASGQPLELPVVHFYCGHSFNQRSLGDGDAECPICAPDFRRVLEIRRHLAASASQQDRFFTELREHADGFSVVAEHFGRGIMNLTTAAVSNTSLD